MAERIMPRYRVFMPSKGRADYCLSAMQLVKDSVSFTLVVEPDEADDYAKHWLKDEFAFEDTGDKVYSNPGIRMEILPFEDRGLHATRSCIKDWAMANGEERHWQIDDNIRHWGWRYKAKRMRVDAGIILRLIEDYTDRYENVAISGPNYYMFVPDHVKYPFLSVNAHVYSCLALGSRVLTADLSWVPIESLKVGDSLIGFDEFPLGSSPRKKGYESSGDTQYRHLHPATVTSTAKLSRPSYRIRFEDGRVVVASSDHRWLARGEKEYQRKVKNRSSRLSGWGWVTTDHLRVGDKVRSFGQTWEPDETFDGGWLSGIFDGEGSLVGSKSGNSRAVVGFAQAPGIVQKRAVDLLQERGFPDSQQGVRANGVWNWTTSGLYKTLRLLGTLRPVRLLDKVPVWIDGFALNNFGGAVVVEIEYVGEREVIALGTSTATLIAEGLFSHNCSLIRSDRFRWRIPLNDDTDYCLQVLATGNCTILFHALLQQKLRTMLAKGGNTDEFYKKRDGRLRMARMLERMWPGVVTTERRFQRPQHVIAGQWKKFDTPLIQKPRDQWPSIDYLDRIRPVQVREIKSSYVKSLKEQWEVEHGL